MGKDILASLFFPTLHILEGNIGGHIHMTAVAAPKADDVSIPFGGHYGVPIISSIIPGTAFLACSTDTEERAG
jgi:hypothetical protein